MFGIPINDDGGEKVKACHAEVLALGGAIADFTLSTDTQGVFQGVMRFAFVQTDLGAARAMSASSNQSMMNSVRSTRPISLRASANSCCRG